MSILFLKLAAIRAKIAGYDGIQIHVAHFFFLSKFISPLYNSRGDEYGGSPARRAKINGDDFTDDGLTLNDCVAACEVMKNHGLDAVEISGNYTSRAPQR